MSTRSLRRLVLAVLLSTLAVPLAGTAAPPIDGSTPPFTIPANSGFASCPFDLQLQLSGKAKQLDLPGGRVLVTSPGLSVTLTNLVNGNSATVNITGAFHQFTEGGLSVTVTTGRSLLGDPGAGLVLAIGDFSFAFDADGGLVRPLSGTGQLIDVCSLVR